MQTWLQPNSLQYCCLSFTKLVRTQPHWYALQGNGILWLGYSLLIGGTVLLYKAFKVVGFLATFYGEPSRSSAFSPRFTVSRELIVWYSSLIR